MVSPYWYGTGLMGFDTLVDHLVAQHNTKCEVVLGSNVGLVHYMQHEAWGDAGHEHDLHPAAHDKGSTP